jgi:hypothetical protein
MRIGADHRAGLKNSPDCDDRILERRNGDNRAAGAARIYKCVEIIRQKSGKAGRDSFIAIRYLPLSAQRTL